MGVALGWGVAVGGLAYVAATLLGGRTGNVAWLDVPVVAFGAVWAVLVFARRSKAAVVWAGWAGLGTILWVSAASGGIHSPVLFLLLLHLSFVERFSSRRGLVGVVVAALVSVVCLMVVEPMGLLRPPPYRHSGMETSLIVLASVALSGVLQAGRWDERSRTLGRLLRSTESLSAVNGVLASTKADALARARQQQVLARLTVHALAHTPSDDDADDSKLDTLISRCCAITRVELGGGSVRVRTLGDGGRVVAEVGQVECDRDRTVAHLRHVDAAGSPWGVLEIEVDGTRWDGQGLSANERLFIDGVVSLLSAAVGRVHTARMLRAQEARLREAQRFEGLALRASGVVHDLNNALTCILQNSELALEGIEPDSDVALEVADIRRAALGATDIARQLLKSARSSEPTEERSVQLSSVVVEELRSHEVTLSDGIVVDCDIADFDGWVPLSPGAAHQIFMNLVVNARQAMPGGGHLMVVLGPSMGLGGRPCVELQVADTGRGIPEDVLARIFEPMFTTRLETGGTGLGLATVRSIVEEAGGRVEVHSAVGEGSTFTITLPQLVAPDTLATLDPAEEAETSEGATILLVDDDPRVRASVHRSLLRFGYNVIEAADGAEALALSAEYGDEIDLLVTDFRMPDMTGVELGQRVREAGLDLPLLLVTGSLPGMRFLAGEGMVDQLLEKPFTPRQLVDLVEASLAQRRPRSGEPGGAPTG